MARHSSTRAGRIAGCGILIMLVLGMVGSANWQTQAQDVSYPSVAGDWKVKLSGQKLKLSITQKGRELTGEARYPRDGRLSFAFFGTIDIAGEVVIDVFWSENEKAPEVKPEAWAQAVKDRYANPKYPNMLQIDGLVHLQRKQDTGTMTESLEGKLVIPSLKVKLKADTGAFEKIDSITDKELETEIKRSYADRCEFEMGTIPAFNCLDGGLLEITVAGAAQATPVARCDRPVQLPLDGDGQCVPGSRLLRLPRSAEHPKVLTIAICRKYTAALKAEEFSDIAMVSHNPATGNTCFFQSEFGKVYDGRKVPSPTDEDHAHDVWGDRKADTTRGLFGPAGVRCNACHAAGPFLWTPYVGQVVSSDTALTDWNGEGLYQSNFADMFGTTSKFLTPESNACRTCHRLGDGTSCSDHSPEFTKFDHANGSERKIWMPPEFTGTQADFDRDYGPALAQLARCCADPTLAECETREATTDTPVAHVPVRPVRRDR
ncbi:hypothetical protein JQ543_28530 [Bradyrhizobium diazoefficiens]|nr:hypothetical protein [Bradyrhizobium diazoefficiens]MBR0851716.1 hypothetical protein [Bradyrhizobium diazoefficiens]